MTIAKRAATALALLPPLAFAAMLALGLNANVIVSGSMEPGLPVGSLVVYETAHPEELKPGDVISFERPRGDHAVMTHRIVSVDVSDGRPAFRTKGDNNAVADPWLIHYERAQQPHRMLFALPYVGNVLLWTRAPLVRIALIVLALGFVYLTFLRALARASGSRTRSADSRRIGTGWARWGP